PELKFHRDSCDHPHRKVDPENPRPESRRIPKALLAAAKMPPFEIHDDPRQSHRELRKQIVIGDRERELHARPEEGVRHKSLRNVHPASYPLPNSPSRPNLNPSPQSPTLIV